MPWRCPKDPTHDKFLAQATLTQEWLVDANGEWLETKGDVEMVRAPIEDTFWTCAICGCEKCTEVVEED